MRRRKQRRYAAIVYFIQQDCVETIVCRHKGHTKTSSWNDNEYHHWKRRLT